MKLTLKEHRKLGKLLKKQRDLLLGETSEKNKKKAKSLNDQIRNLLDDNMHANFDEDKCRNNYFG